MSVWDESKHPRGHHGEWAHSEVHKALSEALKSLRVGEKLQVGSGDPSRQPHVHAISHNGQRKFVVKVGGKLQTRSLGIGSDKAAEHAIRIHLEKHAAADAIKNPFGSGRDPGLQRQLDNLTPAQRKEHDEYKKLGLGTAAAVNLAMQRNTGHEAHAYGARRVEPAKPGVQAARAGPALAAKLSRQADIANKAAATRNANEAERQRAARQAEAERKAAGREKRAEQAANRVARQIRADRAAGGEDPIARHNRLYGVAGSQTPLTPRYKELLDKAHASLSNAAATNGEARMQHLAAAKGHLQEFARGGPTAHPSYDHARNALDSVKRSTAGGQGQVPMGDRRMSVSGANLVQAREHTAKARAAAGKAESTPKSEARAKGELKLVKQSEDAVKRADARLGRHTTVLSVHHIVDGNGVKVGEVHKEKNWMERNAPGRIAGPLVHDFTAFQVYKGGEGENLKRLADGQAWTLKEALAKAKEHLSAENLAREAKGHVDAALERIGHAGSFHRQGGDAAEYGVNAAQYDAIDSIRKAVAALPAGHAALPHLNSALRSAQQIGGDDPAGAIRETHGHLTRARGRLA